MFVLSNSTKKIDFLRYLQIGKKKYEEKMKAYKEVMRSFQFSKLLKAFWSYEATTPEEYETMRECRAVQDLFYQ